MSNYYLTHEASVGSFKKTLLDNIKDELWYRPIVFLCIGTDKCIGDSLGPIIGHKLSKYIKNDRLKILDIHIYGSLKSPVHALNLHLIIDEIAAKFNNPYIVAIDAALGKREKIGQISIGKGPLTPGLGVNKTLPSVGDLHITGIVNCSHISLAHLNKTPLYSIMEMADFIVDGILTVLFCSVKVN